MISFDTIELRDYMTTKIYIITVTVYYIINIKSYYFILVVSYL